VSVPPLFPLSLVLEDDANLLRPEALYLFLRIPLFDWFGPLGDFSVFFRSEARVGLIMALVRSIMSLPLRLFLPFAPKLWISSAFFASWHSTSLLQDDTVFESRDSFNRLIFELFLFLVSGY